MLDGAIADDTEIPCCLEFSGFFRALCVPFALCRVHLLWGLSAHGGRRIPSKCAIFSSNKGLIRAKGFPPLGTPPRTQERESFSFLFNAGREREKEAENFLPGSSPPCDPLSG